MNEARKLISSAKRIVIKVGTSTLTYDTGKVNFGRIDKLAMTISDLMNQEKEIVLVTSGAIGVGAGKLKLKEKPKTIGEKQAVAAVGQCELMNIYSKFFSQYSHIVAQILLTRDIVEEHKSRKNVLNTFENLFAKQILPIVNENDSVSIDEIEFGVKKVFGDNDTLSAIVSEIIKADLLILLSDIDGFYDSDPKNCDNAKIISEIYNINSKIEHAAGGVGSKRGTGGMKTKITAAKIATNNGINMVISNGSNPEVIMDILKGENVGSLFVAKT
jgi:glutamate 5-kinase